MLPRLSETTREEIRSRLLDLFDRQRRDLPWRDEPDPYRVWVSEVMLQQTRVESAIPYYERWIERFPTVESLADADRDEVLREWAGLGYYARARNLHRAARIVRDRFDGELPRTSPELRELPGVGAYTAGAIASIAFGEPAAAVDANARRVLARLFDVEDPTVSRIRRLAERLVPEGRPGDFNQAVMELGATICTSRSPACGACPVAGLCVARARGTVGERPGREASPPPPAYDVGTAVLLSDPGRVLLARRPENGMLGGMWEFPGTVVDDGDAPDEAVARLASRLLGTAETALPPPLRIERVDHGYTHRRHTYHAFLFALDREPEIRLEGIEPGWTEAVWVPSTGVEERALPTAQSEIARRLLERLP